MERLRGRPAPEDDHVVIMTKPSTESVARVIAQALRLHGWSFCIRRHYEASDRRRLHLVLAPQGYSRLPPLRIAFQFEQHVATQYFTAVDWWLLGFAEDILEYSAVNRAVLYTDERLFRSVDYLPPCPDPELFQTWASRSRNCEKKSDLFFVGAMNARRENILRFLQDHFSVRIASGLYGDELFEAMAGCRAVLNLHYYEDAVHEVVRVQESLACGLPVISETSSDQYDFDYPEGWVTFLPDLTSPEGIHAIRKLLNNTEMLAPDLLATGEWVARRFDAYARQLDARVRAAYARLSNHESA